MGYLFKVLRSGPKQPTGFVDIPFLGAKVGEMISWTLTRRGDEGPEAGLYDLRAAFSFFVEPLWNDDDYPKRVVVNLSANKQYRLNQTPGFRTDRQGMSLLMEGVTLDGI